jgi:hypothetical protein
VQGRLERIEAINLRVNAVVELLADEALQAADKADRRLAAGEAVGPLHGVPLSVKENVDVAGLPTTNGVPAMAEAMAPVDAPQVAHLHAAGAIPLGRTNMPDFASRWHTDNALQGATRNPWGRGAHPGRLQRRRGSRPGDGDDAAGRRDRHRRLPALARSVLWHLFVEDDAGPHSWGVLDRRARRAGVDLSRRRHSGPAVLNPGASVGAGLLVCEPAARANALSGFDAREVLPVEDPTDEFSAAANPDLFEDRLEVLLRGPGVMNRAAAISFVESPRSTSSAISRWRVVSE